MILLHRLLLNLSEASDRDIYIGSHYSSPTGSQWNPSTNEALSSLEFDRQEETVDEEQGTFFLGMCNNHSYI